MTTPAKPAAPTKKARRTKAEQAADLLAAAERDENYKSLRMWIDASRARAIAADYQGVLGALEAATEFARKLAAKPEGEAGKVE